MKWIVNSEEMNACDSNTIRHFKVPAIVLMERAALCFVDEVVKNVPSGRILAVCGNGNNGADGLAAVRLLYQRGYQVTAVQVPDNGKRTKENQLQRDILAQYGIHILEQLPKEMHFDCVADALFGVGLSREPKGIYAEWISYMNACSGLKAAIDMPSGVSSDDGTAYDPAFAADITVTFAYQKAGQVLYPGCRYCGDIITAEIGITDQSWLGVKPSCFTLEPSDLKQLPYRHPRGNKGTFGHVLAVAGSRQMAGAALFCAKAAYCTGCGLVKIYTAESNRQILQSTLPEAILTVYDDEAPQEANERQSLAEALKWADAVILGPGIGQSEQAQRMATQVLSDAAVPVIADADALNLLAGNLHLLQAMTAPLVITPHLGEMARLCGRNIKQIQSSLRQTAEQFAKSYQLTCVLKDAVTVTAGTCGTSLNTSGCSAMAKGGSGDVLAGMIAGLAAQGMDPEHAAHMGVYLHGLAGSLAARRKGSYSVLARDIIDAIGAVMEPETLTDGRG
ncbi:MAG: NAD(P)H-hydrate dehydratase [Eubacterium sp.]|nr:NAD(P)H-hydrate dehydratase [Eubacterium sp.]